MFFIIFILFILYDFQTNALQCLSSSDKKTFSKGTSCQFDRNTEQSIPNDSDLTSSSGCRMVQDSVSLSDGLTIVHSCYGEVSIDYQTKAMKIFFTHVSPVDAPQDPYDDMLALFEGMESVVQYKINGNLKDDKVHMTTRVQCKTSDNCAVKKLRQLLANLTIIETRREIFKQVTNFLIPPTSAAASELTCVRASMTGSDGVCENKQQFCRYEKSKLWDKSGCIERDSNKAFDLKYRFNVIEQMKDDSTVDPERGLKCFYLCKTDLCNSEENALKVSGMLHGFAFASGTRANNPITPDQAPQPQGGQKPRSDGISLRGSFFYQSMIVVFLLIQLFLN